MNGPFGFSLKVKTQRHAFETSDAEGLGFLTRKFLVGYSRAFHSLAPQLTIGMLVMVPASSIHIDICLDVPVS